MLRVQQITELIDVSAEPKELLDTLAERVAGQERVLNGFRALKRGMPCSFSRF